jgi:hypothetical protein
MLIRKEHPIQIEFAADETNAARRLVWRLVSGHGFAPTDRSGGLAATIDGREYQLNFALATDGSCVLRADNAAAESLLPALGGSILREWQNPEIGPTSRRFATCSALAIRVEALLRRADSQTESI